MMKSAEDWSRYDAAHVLDGAMDRSVLVERPVGPQLVIVGGILRQNPAQVRFAQDNHMVHALAPDRSDQTFVRGNHAPSAAAPPPDAEVPPSRPQVGFST